MAYEKDLIGYERNWIIKEISKGKHADEVSYKLDCHIKQEFADIYKISSIEMSAVIKAGPRQSHHETFLSSSDAYLSIPDI